MKPSEICLSCGIIEPTFFNRKDKCGFFQVSEVKCLKELEAGKAKPGKVYAEVSIENYALKDLIEK